MQYSVTLRNNQLDQIEATVGASGLLKMYTGAKPANCAAATTGTQLAAITLPADWMENASNGTVIKAGTWQDPAADAEGILGYFRIFDAAGVTCHIQGTITLTGGGGDMTVDNTSVMPGQGIMVTGFSVSAGNV